MRTNQPESRTFECADCGITVRVRASSKASLCSDCKEVLLDGVDRVTREKWGERYNKWKEEALQECHDGSGSIIDETPLDELEVTEQGKVRIIGSNIITEANHVTPWKESEHYCHYIRDRR